MNKFSKQFYCYIRLNLSHMKNENYITSYFFILTVLLILLFSVGLSLFAIKYEVFAHSFTSDDAVTFLAIAKQAETELELANKNFPSNITLAMNHAYNAERLLNNVYYIDDNIVEDQDFIQRYNKEMSSKNNTIHSLVVADLLDQILRNYASAIGLKVDLANMSNVVVLDNFDKSRDSKVSINTSTPNYKQYKKLISTNNTILSYDDYETAVALTEEVKNILKNLETTDSITNKSKSDFKISKLKNDIEKLYTILINNGSGGDLMRLVHLNIHPGLQEAFDLKTRMNMNVNMLDGQLN